MKNINRTSGIKILIICLISLTKSLELNSTTHPVVMDMTPDGDEVKPPNHGKYFYADFYMGNAFG